MVLLIQTFEQQSLIILQTELVDIFQILPYLVPYGIPQPFLNRAIPPRIILDNNSTIFCSDIF